MSHEPCAMGHKPLTINNGLIINLFDYILQVLCIRRNQSQRLGNYLERQESRYRGIIKLSAIKGMEWDGGWGARLVAFLMVEVGHIISLHFPN